MSSQLLVIILIVAAISAAYVPDLFLRGYAELVAGRQRRQAKAMAHFAHIQCALASLFRNEYIADSEVTAWMAANEEAHSLATDGRFVHRLPEPDATRARLWCQQIRSLDDAVRAHNKHFLAERLWEERDTFDAVEKYPLTERQRLAIITDQDNTLVIAGAGTGKTSTIVGKVDYLIRRRLAAPQEILVLAFTRKASEELKERLVRLRGHSQVRVRTFHALGLEIMNKVEHKRPTLTKLADDDQALHRFVRARVEEMLAQPEYQRLMVQFFSTLLDEEPPGAHTEIGDQSVRLQQRRGLRSLTGEQLKSREEVRIANWLTLNGIAWEYERNYPFAKGTDEYRPYRPDFYLPDYDVYIEHFGVDEEGNTRPGIDRDRYHEEMEWKRTLHREHGSKLVETFSYLARQGRLTQHLETLLRQHSVVPKPLTELQIQAIVVEANRPFSEFVKLLTQFLNLYKGNGYSLEAAARKADSERDQVFLRIFQYVFERYNFELQQADEIDFNDMLTRARAYVREQRYCCKFKYILVDEFQDISENQLGLLQNIRTHIPHSRLFAVGDDWQAIYRFTGSDVSIITNFPEHVGATVRIDLDTTFRHHQELVDFSSRFIMANPQQLQKTLCSHHGSQGELPFCVVFQRGDNLRTALQTACQDIVRQQAGIPASVFILGRHHHNKPPFFQQVCANLQRHHISVEYFTAHASKGKETDYVIVIGLEAGEYGFPSNVSDDPVMKMVLRQAESYEYAEERRLFYVAVTRARQRVYLIAPRDNLSPFVEQDILDGKLDVCERCRKGALILIPEEEAGFQVYRCTLCRWEAERCPCCGLGHLSEKIGAYGAFLGCSRWNRGKGCTYTRSQRR